MQHLAFSPDGAKLATAGGDGQAMLVDAASHAGLVALPGQSMAAYAVAFSANGEQLALGSGSGLVTLLDAARGSTEYQFGSRPAQIRTVAFSPARRLLASAGLTGVVDVRDIPTRSLSAKLHGHEQRIWSLSFSPDGKLVASGGDDGSIHVWKSDSESALAQFESAVPIYEVKFGSERGTLLTADDRRQLITWDAATVERLAARDLPGAHLPDLVFSPDRQKLALRSPEGDVWLGESLAGDFNRFDPGLKSPPCRIALARDHLLLVFYRDSTMDVWDTATPALLDRRSIAHVPGAWPAAVSRDGGLVAVCCGKILLLYDVARLCPRFETTNEPAELYSVAVSPDGRLIAAGADDGSLAFFDTASGKRTLLLAGHQHWIDSLAFSPDGRTLATGGHGGAIRLWNVATREELFVLRHLDSNSQVRLDFSLDGRRLAAFAADRDNHGHLYVWSPDSVSP